MRLIELAWKDFANRVFAQYPPSKAQYEAMRAAFYAGASVTLQEVSELSNKGEDLGVLILESLWIEVHAFAKNKAVKNNELN